MRRANRATWLMFSIVVAAPALFLALLVWSGARVHGQDAAHGEVNLLPPSTGEALTVTPVDQPELSCSVVQWKNDPSSPTLAIICPPQGVFAPLHVYLKLSWLKPEDVPSLARGITAPEKMLIQLRSDHSMAWVRVGVRERQGGASHMTWVPFNGLADMALVTLHRKR